MNTPFARRSRPSSLRPLVLCAGAAFLCASAAPAAADLGAGSDAQFKQDFGAAFFDQYWRLHPNDAIDAGYYKVAGFLNTPNEADRAARLRFLNASLAKLRKIDPAKLDAETRTDRAVLENQLAGEIWYLTEFRDWSWDPSLYNVADAFALIENTEYAPLETRLRSVLARLAHVPAYYAAAKSSIKDPTREHTELAIEQSEGTLGVLGEDLEHKVAAAKLSASEQKLFTQRIAAARTAINDYIAWLKDLDQHLASATPRSFRIGRALYEPKFAFDINSGSSAEELFERAQKEKERLLERMDVLTIELWPKYFPDAALPGDRFERIGTLIRRMSEQHATRENFFQEVSQKIPELEAWVAEHDLLTIDTSKPLRVRVTPPYKQGVSAASLDSPGPYDAGAPSFFNVLPLENLSAERAESLLREYNRWMMPILVIHEAVPGHYVQLVHANKTPSLIKTVFGNGAMVEGWAVYGERMMLESGYGGDTAEEWLIYSKWNLRSVANTILDYSVHVLNMSEADARDLLVRQAFQSDEEARGKWRRVSVTSVQLTSYFAGYSAIYDFRERMKQAQHGQFNLKHFNEQFLSYGNAPVKVIEELMTAKPDRRAD
jgi:uncharacterized protein (DUF885 family)